METAKYPFLSVFLLCLYLIGPAKSVLMTSTIVATVVRSSGIRPGIRGVNGVVVNFLHL